MFKDFRSQILALAHSQNVSEISVIDSIHLAHYRKKKTIVQMDTFTASDICLYAL